MEVGSRSSIYERDPCPIRVFGDAGGGFAIGIIGGTLWHGFRGSYQAPKGEKLVSMILTIARKAPRTAAAFAAWGGAFSVLDCTISTIRRKEDVWGPIMAGTLVGASLPMRRGRRAMILGAIGGFVILSAIEGLQVWMSNRMIQDQSKMAPVGLPQQ